MIYIAVLLMFIYSSYIFWWICGWKKTDEYIPNSESNIKKISIIVPCRNESKNIIQLIECIKNQNFDTNCYELIIVDDHSIDCLLEDLIKISTANYSSFNIKIIKLNENEKGKKLAITKGINCAKGEIIICTDADCKVGKNWLKNMSGSFANSEIKLIFGPVMFNIKKGFWYRLLQLDFLSLIAIGASSLQNKKPSMCNGANIAYLKSAFIEINGFEGNYHIESGDDEFLMHKIFYKYKNSVKFIKNRDAIVYTKAPADFNEFVNQRLRWASKAGHYQNIISKSLPYFVVILNFFLLFYLFISIFMLDFLNLLIIFCYKIILDFVFFWSVLNFFNSRKLIMYIIPAQFFHCFYITFISLFTIGRKYKWKDREIKY